MATGTRGIKHFQTPERLKALGDGVFAIALTLLIIDVVAVAKEVEELLGLVVAAQGPEACSGASG